MLKYRSLSSSPPVGMLMGSSFDARMLQRLHSNDDDYEGVGKRTEEEKDNSDEEDEDKDELVDVEDDDDEVVLLEGEDDFASIQSHIDGGGVLQVPRAAAAATTTTTTAARWWRTRLRRSAAWTGASTCITCTSWGGRRPRPSSPCTSGRSRFYRVPGVTVQSC